MGRGQEHMDTVNRLMGMWAKGQIQLNQEHVPASSRSSEVSVNWQPNRAMQFMLEDPFVVCMCVQAHGHRHRSIHVPYCTLAMPRSLFVLRTRNGEATQNHFDGYARKAAKQSDSRTGPCCPPENTTSHVVGVDGGRKCEIFAGMAECGRVINHEAFNRLRFDR